MQYTDYIMNDNARREREIQLANQYNQQPESQKVQNLWMINVEKQSRQTITFGQILEIIAGLIIVGGLILASIWL